MEERWIDVWFERGQRCVELDGRRWMAVSSCALAGADRFAFPAKFAQPSDRSVRLARKIHPFLARNNYSPLLHTFVHLLKSLSLLYTQPFSLILQGDEHNMLAAGGAQCCAGGTEIISRRTRINAVCRRCIEIDAWSCELR